MTTALTARPRVSALDRDTAMRLAATEYDRVVALLEGLAPHDWAKPTDCPAWDVRAVAAHLLGMAEMSASMRESMRQVKAAQARGGVFIDELTDLQVTERAGMAPAGIVARYAEVAPKAVKARRRMPWFVRRQKMPAAQVVNAREETWTLGFLSDVIMTRDPWMHRTDLARATGAPLVLTAEHDGVLVDDVVREWHERLGRPVTLRLTGPAGGTWGEGGPELEFDAVEFCRALSGRGTAPLDTEVPF
ncbi:maleylpyruvate isomerase family mycothiol-dependent enzyme [Lentzea sp. BCCO 10_0061]|uniref:Maleylpyruvate isomerase family mycothiol-dependent enzyme n=1 Tax=Lentzea sokolovensis TaxID=3095429 RepID=A0ABU4V8G7_9PSEU|nr:maleylpyruvate isomerase family mycothiol-dependent enzyme [Lentzea sp. BCCO 10_0061]MDX8148086.1 maleylpyruvate isomerase family mycothiol-dependent enzyme [Lentzea sp. BCCO 10_0061]